MPRPARFKQADATRALKAAVRAGLNPAECVIDAAGTIRLVFNDGQPATVINPLDRLLQR